MRATMTWREQFLGFYSILDTNDEHFARLLVRPLAEGGAGSRVLQVRMKPPVPTREIVNVARMARRVTAEAGALLIVNDRVDIALAVDADGAHIGQEDLALRDARALAERVLPERSFLIGVSANTLDQVVEAVDGGADYVGFGPVYPTATKIDADPVRGCAALREAVLAAKGVPVVAIGGITPERAPDVAATGARAACVISAVNHAQDPALAGRRIGAAWGL